MHRVFSRDIEPLLQARPQLDYLYTQLSALGAVSRAERNILFRYERWLSRQGGFERGCGSREQVAPFAQLIRDGQFSLENCQRLHRYSTLRRAYRVVKIQQARLSILRLYCHVDVLNNKKSQQCFDLKRERIELILRRIYHWVDCYLAGKRGPLNEAFENVSYAFDEYKVAHYNNSRSTILSLWSVILTELNGLSEAIAAEPEVVQARIAHAVNFGARAPVLELTSRNEEEDEEQQSLLGR